MNLFYIIAVYGHASPLKQHENINSLFSARFTQNCYLYNAAHFLTNELTAHKLFPISKISLQIEWNAH